MTNNNLIFLSTFFVKYSGGNVVFAVFNEKKTLPLFITESSIQESEDQDIHQGGLWHHCRIRLHKKKQINWAVGMVTLFAFLFNGSRWFEISVEVEEVCTNSMHCKLQNRSLK